MKKLLLNNWPLKLVAVLLSVGIWMMVIYITDPADTTSFIIPINYENEDIVTQRGHSVTIVGDQYVTVRVTKNRSIVSSLTTGDFKAVADFAKMYEDSQVPVTVTYNGNKLQSGDYTQDKFSLEVKLEDLKTVTVPITYELVGQPAEGFAIGEVAVEPDTITVTAPESYADIIRQAVVSIDVSDVSDDFTAEAELQIFDGNGVELNPSESKDAVMDTDGTVSCSVKLFLIKRVPVIVNAQDTERVAEGYQYVGATVAPDYITISGTRAVMGQVSSVLIDDVSAAGLSESRRVEVNIKRFLPDNINIVGDTTYATVTLLAEPLVERSFEIDPNNIEVVNVPDGISYRITTSPIMLTLIGLEADLNSLEAEDVALTLDLEGRGAGSANISLGVTLPSDVYQTKGNCMVNVRLSYSESGEPEGTSFADE